MIKQQDWSGTDRLGDIKVVQTKMSQEQRAKQFMPFAALKGYSEALRKKERIAVQKAELSEDYLEELNRRFLQIKRKDMIEVVYFHQNEYLKITGMVSGIDKVSRVLKVVNTEINFDDIYDLRIGEG